MMSDGDHIYMVARSANIVPTKEGRFSLIKRVDPLYLPVSARAGKITRKEKWLHTCTIVTGESNEFVREIPYQDDAGHSAGKASRRLVIRRGSAQLALSAASDSANIPEPGSEPSAFQRVQQILVGLDRLVRLSWTTVCLQVR